MNKIPVIIIAGFLGSGKTTIINNLLKSASDTKVGVIVNDFGEINIDALLVSSTHTEPIELASGCLCCMMDENSLEKPVSQLAKSGVDVIIIEASGLAELREITHKLLALENDQVSYGGLVYVIDEPNFTETYQKHGFQIKNSLKTADLIIINKTDKISSKTTKILNSFAPSTSTVCSPSAAIEPRLLFDVKKTRSSQPSLFQTTKHHHTHHAYSSVSLQTESPLDPTKFINFINFLPPEIYRAKGIIYFGMKGYEQKYTFQKVGSYKKITHEEWQDQEPHTKLVLIGTNLNKDSLNTSLQNLIDPTPQDLSPENMIKL